MLTALFSAILLFVSPSLETLREHHLETPAGRVAFLTQSLSPYVATAAQLNEEVLALSKEIQELNPEENRDEIVALTQQAIEKMNLLKSMIPVLELALHADEDFQQIDALLTSDSLTAAQQEVADRIASLCRSL